MREKKRGEINSVTFCRRKSEQPKWIIHVILTFYQFYTALKDTTTTTTTRIKTNLADVLAKTKWCEITAVEIIGYLIKIKLFFKCKCFFSLQDLGCFFPPLLTTPVKSESPEISDIYSRPICAEKKLWRQHQSCWRWQKLYFYGAGGVSVRPAKANGSQGQWVIDAAFGPWQSRIKSWIIKTLLTHRHRWGKKWRVMEETGAEIDSWREWAG